MVWLTLGLVIFLGIHCLPHFQTGRQALIQRYGAMPYKGIFSLVSGLGFALLVVGVIQRSYIPLWTPPAWGRDLAIGAMLPALILLCAANFPNNIQRLAKHPMLIGLLLWAGAHLLANGDLASLMLFGGFGVFALFDIWSVTREARSTIKTNPQSTPIWRDVAAVVLGLGLYSALLWWHGDLFGSALVLR